jgi:hypothetical protein
MPTDTAPPQALATLGTIARRCGTVESRVAYVIRSRRIRPAGRAGNAWVYSDAAVATIAAALKDIEGRKRDRLARAGGVDHVA